MEVVVTAPGRILRSDAAPFDGTTRPLADRMADASAHWADIAARHRPSASNIDRLASWCHTNADLGGPIEVVADMTTRRKDASIDFQSSPDAFIDLFQRLEAERIISKP